MAAVVGFAGCYAFLGWHLLTDWLPRGHASASAALVAAYVASPCLMLAARRDSRRWHRALAYALSAVATVLLGLALTRVELPS